MVLLVKSSKTNPLGLVEETKRAHSKIARGAKRGREAPVDERRVMFDTEGRHPA